MTDTEYRGYTRYHSSVEEPLFRENAKTTEAKNQYAKTERQLSSEWKSALTVRV